MDKLIVMGQKQLKGEVCISGAKNAAVAIIPAAIMADDVSIIENLPCIEDVSSLCNTINKIGAKSSFLNKHTLQIDGRNINNICATYEEVQKIRASYYLLGALLARFKKAEVAMPGGCNFGTRPIDLHLNALKRLGVDIKERDGCIYCRADVLKGADISLDFPSVGATENIMLAAVKAKGKTLLSGAAKEPEIVDLQNFLNGMGAKVNGAGTDEIEIEGVESLSGITYKPVKDRIEAGTFLIACAICGGEMEVVGVKSEFVGILLHKLRENGCKIHVKNDKIVIESSGRLKCNRRIETMPFPGFPTDLQAQMTALNSVSSGGALVVENLFETRFKYVPELKKMGADIEVKGRSAFVRGVERLRGASVTSGDLRGGAALVLAALGAEGTSEVLDLSHIDRGYYDLQGKLKSLGAEIKRVRV